MITLTPEQIKNWRKILYQSMGPYALIMDEYEVQRYRDEMQEKINEEGSMLA